MTSHSRKPRPFKSAEKPVSLYPLSYKQALEALLQVGPVSVDPPADPGAPDPAASDSKTDLTGS
jgi:hypothetical protein